MKSDWPKTSVRNQLVGDEAHVWAVPLVTRRFDADTLLETLSWDERERANGFHFDDPRRRFVIARAALRRLLGGYLELRPADIELTSDRNGKPRLSGKHNDADLHFNVSHSGDLALIAVARGGDVGVDVEQVRDVGHLEQIARRFFHPSETEAVLAAPPDDRNTAFLRCWTGKEAVLKAFGTGITGSLADFQVPVSESWQGWIEWPTGRQGAEASRCWLQQLTPCDGYIGAIACAGVNRPIRCSMMDS